MKNILLLLLFCLLFVAVKCPKTDLPIAPKLPQITQTGAGTFGCLLNEQVWLPGGAAPWIIPQYYQGRLSISVHTDIYKSGQVIGDQSILFSIKPLNDTGKYYISDVNDGASFSALTYNVSNHEYKVKYPDSLQNWVYISKLDSTKFIVSGTFNLFFTAPGQDTIRIANGRFDDHYAD